MFFYHAIPHARKCNLNAEQYATPVPMDTVRFGRLQPMDALAPLAFPEGALSVSEILGA
jgi:hypothetical protein